MTVEKVFASGSNASTVLNALVQAGEIGLGLDFLCKAINKDAHKTRAMVNLLRIHGYKVDNIEGTYILRGMGQSVQQNHGVLRTLSDQNSKWKKKKAEAQTPARKPPPNPVQNPVKIFKECHYQTLAEVTDKLAMKEVERIVNILKEHGVTNIETIERLNPSILEIRQIIEN